MLHLQSFFFPSLWTACHWKLATISPLLLHDPSSSSDSAYVKHMLIPGNEKDRREGGEMGKDGCWSQGRERGDNGNETRDASRWGSPVITFSTHPPHIFSIKIIIHLSLPSSASFANMRTKSDPLYQFLFTLASFFGPKNGEERGKVPHRITDERKHVRRLHH